MRIDQAKCLGCGRCIPYCTMRAIDLTASELHPGRVVSRVDEDECVDCGVCQRSGVCPGEALRQPVHGWPRSLRGTFSNPLAEHKETRVAGRGTEEMKTNDVTGRFQYGYAGIAAEMGRPGTGARFRDVEKVTMALARLGIEFEPKNPLTFLIEDQATGSMKADVLDEKVLSAIIEFVVPVERVPEVLATLDRAAAEIDTVFSVDLICRLGPDGDAPATDAVRRTGHWLSINGKTNVGLGRARSGGVAG